MASADKDDEGKNGGFGPAVVMGGVAFFVVGYVPSIGPAAWLNMHGYLPESVKYFYAPILFAADQWQPVSDALQWYLGLWGVK